jgi:drug/metabolite transporter (DMT)-like permease
LDSATSLALALVLASALAHATWNLLAKRAAGAQPAGFTWLFTLVSCVICAPLAIRAVLVDGPSIGVVEAGLMLGSGGLHLAYFLALATGYRHGDLTLVYPLARGSGPLLATIGALVFLGERPSATAWLGVGLVVLGVIALAFEPRALASGNRWRAIAFALLTGVFIGAYTVWDRFAVSQRAIPPVLYFWGICIALLVLLAPLALRRPHSLVPLLRERWQLAVGIGSLSSLAYVLVLTALTITPVSFVAPIRETSVLFASVLGARFLAEGQTLRRVMAACAMLLGISVLALS